MLDVYLLKHAEVRQADERDRRLARDLGLGSYSVADLVKMAAMAPPDAGPPPDAAGGPPPPDMSAGIPAPPPPTPSPVQMPPEDIGAAVGAALKAIKDKEDAVAQEEEAQAAQQQQLEAAAGGAMQPPPEQLPPTFPPGQEPQAPPMPPGMPPAAAPPAGGPPPGGGGPAGPAPPGMPKAASALRRRLVKEAGIMSSLGDLGSSAARSLGGLGSSAGRFVGDHIEDFGSAIRNNPLPMMAGIIGPASAGAAALGVGAHQVLKNRAVQKAVAEAAESAARAADDARTLHTLVGGVATTAGIGGGVLMGRHMATRGGDDSFDKEANPSKMTREQAMEAVSRYGKKKMGLGIAGATVVAAPTAAALGSAHGRRQERGAQQYYQKEAGKIGDAAGWAHGKVKDLGQELYDLGPRQRAKAFDKDPVRTAAFGQKLMNAIEKGQVGKSHRIAQSGRRRAESASKAKDATEARKALLGYGALVTSGTGAGLGIAGAASMGKKKRELLEAELEKKAAGSKLQTAGLLALGAIPAAATGAYVGGKKGKKKGRTQGLQVGYYLGARKGFQAGAQQGYVAGQKAVRSSSDPKRPPTKPTVKKKSD